MKDIIKKFTLNEKILLLIGKNGKETAEMETLGIKSRTLVDGPHGVREDEGKNSTHFPNLCCIGASWDKDMIYEMGQALALECINQGIALLIGPGINIKRYMLCGRNFEYISEDPVLSGEMAASYIGGVQSKGIGTCLKHFAANNQEQDRMDLSVEIDERTLREIYLKSFEIAVKKAKPESVMCAYNKINAIWCAESKYLLNDILKEEWGFDGFVVSDWGAVRDYGKALMAGIDLTMPPEEGFLESIIADLEKGKVTEERIDKAVEKVLEFVTKERPVDDGSYDRQKQHIVARKLAASGIVLLKNDNDTLPISVRKYKKIACLGGYAKNPLISGQGSAEVNQNLECVDSPLAEIKKILPTVDVTYTEIFNKDTHSNTMLWPKVNIPEIVGDAELVLFFIGAMEGDDSEQFDRNTAMLNPAFGYFIKQACELGKKVAVVLQTGSAVILGDPYKSADAIVEMWYGGEAAGGAVADVLCGIVNPSGRLPETFPNKMREDMKYNGDLKLVYNERLDVGYRYYDKHPDEICYPFGHGLSYTKFAYSDCKCEISGEEIRISFFVKNVGDCDGNEIAQVYISDPVSTVTRPLKELKAFEKMFLRSGEKKKIELSVPCSELAYYNTMLRAYVIENGEYNILVGSSSRDIRLSGSIVYESDMPYTMSSTAGKAMIG